MKARQVHVWYSSALTLSVQCILISVLLLNLTDAQIDFSPLNTAKWLYIEGYLSTSDTARQAVKQAREIAKPMVCKLPLHSHDPAMVQYAREGLDELLDDGVDLLFCNEQEALDVHRN